MSKKENMTDDQMVTPDETGADSSTENNNEGEAGASTGDQNQNKGSESNKEDEFKDLPFHEHPRWKQREQEWQEKLEKQERSFNEKLEIAISEAMASNKPQAPKEEENAIANGPIPKWFGGGQDTPEIREMWKEYVAEQTKIIKDAEKNAEERAFERLTKSQTTQSEAVQQANKHFETSIVSIEATYGKKVDRNELLKYVLDNQIIDHTTQKWDYMKGYRWMMAEKGMPVQASQGGNQNIQDRKNLAGAISRDSNKGEKGSGQMTVTSDDFKDPSKRPW